MPYLKQGWQDVGPIGVMIRPSFRMLTKHPDDELPEVSLLTTDHVVSRPLRYQPCFVRDGIAPARREHTECDHHQSQTLQIICSRTILILGQDSRHIHRFVAWTPPSLHGRGSEHVDLRYYAERENNHGEREKPTTESAKVSFGDHCA